MVAIVSDEVTGFAVAPGAYVGFRDRLHIVRRLLSPERILLEDPETQRTALAFIQQLSHPARVPVATQSDEESAPTKNPELLGYTDEEIEKAEEKLAIISPLLAMGARTRNDVTAVAASAGVTAGTIYTWMKDYSESSSLVGLIPEKRGPKGGGRLDMRVEQIIQETIDALYLNSQQLNALDIYETVKDRCEQEGKPAPHENTVRNRIASIPRDTQSRSRGHRAKADLNLPTPGAFPTPVSPLNPVQIDHVLLDMIVVYSDNRQPWGRPWLTLVIDVLTRMIVGFYLSMDRPSSVAAGMALTMGMLPKKDYLGSLGLSGSWPVHGKLRKVHCDNAKEFRGNVLKFGCKEHRIDLELRPVKNPRYGAHIERMVGNVNAMLRKKPGATFSNPKQRGDYDSKKKSAYTLHELEVEVADWIVNHYHVTKHNALQMPPRNAWERAIMGTGNKPAAGLPMQIADPEKLKLDFLPHERRVVSPTGVRLAKSDYYHEVLNRWINAPDPDNPSRKRKFIVKFHPRRTRHVWFLDPELKQYFPLDKFPLSASDADEQEIGHEEHVAIATRKDKEGKAMEDKEAKRAYRQRSGQRQADAVTATKRARTAKPDKTRSTPGVADRSLVEQNMRPNIPSGGDATNPFEAFAGKSITAFPVID